jgi:hypothetical protein
MKISIEIVISDYGYQATIGVGFMKALGSFIALLALLLFLSGCSFCASEEDMEEATEYTFEVFVENVHDSQPLSPGVFVVHTENLSLNFTGQLAPSALEPLAEYGSYEAFAEYVGGLDGLVQMYTIDAPILPGENASFAVVVQTSELPLYLSGIQMAVGTNDGYALLDSVELVDKEGVVLSPTAEAKNYDAGTEENQPLGSGFDGGQPDPTRGEENIDNGVSTEEVVSLHPQLTETVMFVSVD